jgi:hypothetical protein
MADESGPIKFSIRVPKGQPITEDLVSSALGEDFIKKLTVALANDGDSVVVTNKQEGP